MNHDNPISTDDGQQISDVVDFDGEGEVKAPESWKDVFTDDKIIGSDTGLVCNLYDDFDGHGVWPLPGGNYRAPEQRGGAHGSGGGGGGSGG